MGAREARVLILVPGDPLLLALLELQSEVLRGGDVQPSLRRWLALLLEEVGGEHGVLGLELPGPGAARRLQLVAATPPDLVKVISGGGLAADGRSSRTPKPPGPGAPGALDASARVRRGPWGAIAGIRPGAASRGRAGERLRGLQPWPGRRPRRSVRGSRAAAGRGRQPPAQLARGPSPSAAGRVGGAGGAAADARQRGGCTVA